MPNGFARSFYMSREWRACRQAYIASRVLCERCAAVGDAVPGEEVHHKVRLTRANLSDPSIALNWDNLELLCRRCHQMEHGKVEERTDEGGHVDIENVIQTRQKRIERSRKA